jgi:hypothetical protein
MQPMRLILAALVLTPGLVRAETLATDVTPSVIGPSRGSSMASVEARFGAPTTKHEAVGRPPITRWDYPGFSVFFEYDHVVHAVAARAFPQPAG